jgi:hypothetical protein
LLPRATWHDVFDSRLISWLRLIRFGRLDGTLKWPTVYQCLCSYSRELGIASPSAQVAHAVFNSIAKPSYWHGGKGEAVDGVVRQRGTLSLVGRPRLHAAWLIISFFLDVKLPSGIRKRYYALLVVDEGSELPVGGWLSETPPNSREVGLAIYQSIWHPAVIGWPLHGIPEVIRIPAALVTDGLTDLRRAAPYLLTELAIVKKMSLEGKSRIVHMRDDIRKEGAAVVQAAFNGEAVPAGVVLHTLLSWLIPRCFPNHRAAPVWPSIRGPGLAMPGHDTPAAGWLLPVTGDVETVQDGVRSQAGLYRSAWFRPEPGQRLKRREFPLFYPKVDAADPEPGIFVEAIDDGIEQLHYMTNKPA